MLISKLNAYLLACFSRRPAFFVGIIKKKFIGEWAGIVYTPKYRSGNRVAFGKSENMEKEID